MSSFKLTLLFSYEQFNADKVILTYKVIVDALMYVCPSQLFKENERFSCSGYCLMALRENIP